LLLAAFSALPQQKGSFYHINSLVHDLIPFLGLTIKRPGETQTEHSPEAKRPRLQANTESPKVVSQALGAAQPTALASNPIPQQPPSVIPPPVQTPPRFTLQNLEEALRKLEERMQTLELALANARSEGKAEEAQTILQVLMKNKEHYAKIKQTQYIMLRQQAQAQARAQLHLAPNLPQNQSESFP
jgi:hypothetical protein